MGKKDFTCGDYEKEFVMRILSLKVKVDKYLFV